MDEYVLDLHQANVMSTERPFGIDVLERLHHGVMLQTPLILKICQHSAGTIEFVFAL
jgi:hypothetical protein